MGVWLHAWFLHFDDFYTYDFTGTAVNNESDEKESHDNIGILIDASGNNKDQEGKKEKQTEPAGKIWDWRKDNFWTFENEIRMAGIIHDFVSNIINLNKQAYYWILVFLKMNEWTLLFYCRVLNLYQRSKLATF